MDYKSSQDLCEKIAAKNNGQTMLAFSGGKDAVSAWVELRKYFHTIVPVYYYLIPELSFVEKTLAYYEDFFDTKIIRLPNPNLIRMLNAGVFQTPSTNVIIEKTGIPDVKREDLLEYVKQDRGLDTGMYVAIGNRMFDNLARYRTISKHGPVNHSLKTFYPTYDFKIDDVVASCKSAGVKLPVDYHIWGKSFDGLDYRFIRPLKDHFPDDYQKIKSFFPFIDLEIMRYEHL
ncbi:MAG: hypothetical protein J7527_01650 [Chitinophagaceae bacterium]|nr:hypothetical protein [Chitinophagaceae bacterium]